LEAAVVLQASGLTRAFAGVQALGGVNLRLRAGEVHALMGQNGAGKSTLIKLLTGVYAPDAGSLQLNGQAVQPASPAAAQRLGISTVYQEVNLCPNLTVAENIWAGRCPRKGAAGLWRVDHARMQADSNELLARLNISIDVTQRLDSYPVAVQQMVAIARALAPQAGVPCSVLILDEPTSSLDDSEVQRLFTVLRKLRDEGLAILFVTHFLQQMYALSDRITVLRNGQFVGEWLKDELPPAALITAMVGREISAVSEHKTNADSPREVLLAARNYGRNGRSGLNGGNGRNARDGQLQPLSFELHQGEVLGLAGLLGSGRTELARLLFGLARSDSGELQISGQATRLDSPTQAIAQGLALCPEERKAEGIVGELSVRENIALALQARMGLKAFLPLARQRELAESYVRSLGIKTASMETPVALLSGGNQQKVVLARWLATQPRLLILDEPTRGIDIAAKQDIMEQIQALARAGLAVLFISSEMEEVVRVADRILVLRDRALVGELPGHASEQDVYQLIAAGA
jgi:monosaccharide-transporting ATPase